MVKHWRNIYRPLLGGPWDGFMIVEMFWRGHTAGGKTSERNRSCGEKAEPLSPAKGHLQ